LIAQKATRGGGLEHFFSCHVNIGAATYEMAKMIAEIFFFIDGLLSRNSKLSLLA